MVVSQVISQSTTTPSIIRGGAQTLSAPFLLAKRLQGKLTLSVFWNPDGTLAGLLNNRLKVSLKGLPSILNRPDLPNALKMLSEGLLFWNKWAITFQPRLVGGAPPKLGTIAGGMFPPHWSVPPKNGAFVGREPLLTEMKKMFSESGEAIAQVVVAGLGGVGKTSLVLEYLYRNKDLYSTVWWMSGEQPISGYRDLGESLGIVKPTDKGDHVVETVKKWLERNPNWLLVFDNVEDFKTILPYLPSSAKRGHIFITSRNPHSKNSLLVDVFSPKESADLLTFLTGQKENDKAKELGELLGHLPLAVAQSGAYMRETQTTYAEYVNLFQKMRKELWKDERAPKDYSATAGTTWNISAKRIQDEMPEAIGLLEISAYLAPDNFPKVLFLAQGVDPLDLSKWFLKLQQYSFFTVGQKEETYSVHRLVQSSVRDKISLTEEKVVLQILQDRFYKEWKFKENEAATWPKAKLLLSHLTSFCSHVEKRTEFSKILGYFLISLGLYSDHIETNLPLAIDYYQQALKICKELYGEEGQAVATCLNNLGIAYEHLGNLSLAGEYFKESLEIYKKIYGEEHKAVAKCLDNLGVVYKALGNHPQAIEYHRQALAIEKKHYGERDFRLAGTLHNLGSAFEGQGDFSLAITYYKEALSITEEAHDEEHPLVVTILNNLGGAYKGQMNLTLAVRYYKQALAIGKKIYENNHPSVATALGNLGTAYEALGDFDLALNYCMQALIIEKKLYGEMHPKVATTLNNIGAIYKDRGDDSQAIEHYTRALGITKKVWGEEHPQVAIYLNNLGMVYQDQGDLPRAIDYFKNALSIHEKTLGNRNPLTATSLNNLGGAYDAQGDFSLALNCFNKALSINRAAFGEAHPDVARCLNNLATIWKGQKNLARAIDYYKQALFANKLVYGEEHSEIAGGLNNIGIAYHLQGNFSEAIDYYTQSLAVRNSVYGSDHPNVAICLTNLGAAYEDQDDLARAIDCFQQALAINEESYGKEDEQVIKSLRKLGKACEKRGYLLLSLEDPEATEKAKPDLLLAHYCFTQIVEINQKALAKLQGI